MPGTLLLGLLQLAAAPDSGAVGLATFTAIDARRADTVRAAIWYPSPDRARETRLGLQVVHVAPDGRFAGDRRPLVVISHGTGGNEAGHWDTAEALARAGYVVASLRHPGDNSGDDSALGTDRYVYGRAAHVRALLDGLLADSTWRPRIDPDRIGFVGFSAGGYTGMLLLGGRPDLERAAGYCARHPRDCAGRQSGEFRMTGRYRGPTADPRVRSAVLLAPGFGFLFDRAGLAAVRRPVLLVRAERDSVVREPENVTHVARLLPSRPTVRVVPGAGHYVFLAPCSDALARVAPDICRDPPGVERAAVHAELNRTIAAFFERTLQAR